MLISTYDLGRQPFGLASPAAWLRRAGAWVDCLDVAIEPLDEERVRAADLIAFHLPMHTATRLAARLVPRVRSIRPAAAVCCYGLYASMNAAYLRRLGADYILGGEFEAGLASLAERLARERPAHGRQREPEVSLERLSFVPPDRSGLPPLTRYAHLHDRDGRIRVAGATEASRGCRHRCRHCPVVPVYGGRFRVVPHEVVLEDVRRQVEAGAEHITFGDPDFFNGPGHALPLVTEIHRRHPDLTYDVTIKVEHLLRHREHLATLRDTGCRFVTSAIESTDDHILERLDKGHTRNDFLEIVKLFREVGLTLNPTFVAFTPWISLDGYLELLETIEALDLVEHVAPVQLAIRLLIPAGSRLLELREIRDRVEAFDEWALVHPWRHPDPRVDRLQESLEAQVRSAVMRRESRREIFTAARAAAAAAAGRAWRPPPAGAGAPDRVTVPFLTEPWYC